MKKRIMLLLAASIFTTSVGVTTGTTAYAWHTTDDATQKDSHACILKNAYNALNNEKEASISKKEWQAMCAGSNYSDRKLKGIDGVHGWFYRHSINGNPQKTYEVNYITCYSMISRVADYVKSNAENGPIDTAIVDKMFPEFSSKTQLALGSTKEKEQKAIYENMKKGITTALEYGGEQYEDADLYSAFLYGVALHTMTDACAHSTVGKKDGKWVRIDHIVGNKNLDGADDLNGEAGAARIAFATNIAKNAMYRYTQNPKYAVRAMDFVPERNAVDTKDFRLVNLSKNFEAYYEAKGVAVPENTKGRLEKCSVTYNSATDSYN